jgi:hypothetical protein
MTKLPKALVMKGTLGNTTVDIVVENGICYYVYPSSGTISVESLIDLVRRLPDRYELLYE